MLLQGESLADAVGSKESIESLIQTILKCPGARTLADKILTMKQHCALAQYEIGGTSSALNENSHYEATWSLSHRSKLSSCPWSISDLKHCAGAFFLLRRGKRIEFNLEWVRRGILLTPPGQENRVLF